MTETEKTVLRQPIISVLGHVDHGKTTLLDYIRGSVVASREAGGITQHIGATDVPFYVVERLCGSLLDKLKLKTKIRDLLFIDTPGHAAFTNLRRRGGSVADLAILVVDVNEGLMPQTIEAIQILRQYKTPFIVAANKIDAISGFRPGVKVDEQIDRVKEEFYKKFYNLVAQISEHGFDSDIYSNVRDFSRQVAVVPVSAKKGDGIPELLMMLMGLAQQYLSKQLTVGLDSPAKGTILEVKEEKGLGTTIDVIIYDGVIRKDDQIVVGAKNPIVTKVKALLKPMPLDEMRDPRQKFQSVDEVYAASGVKIAAPGLEDALAGSPVYVGGVELVDKVRGELGEIEFTRDSLGVVVKADTLGSLEAIVRILSEENIPVRRGMIGKVSKQDVIEASSVGLEDSYLGAILAFNSPVLDDARVFAEDNGVKIFENKVIYQLLEDYKSWVTSEKEREKAERMKFLVTPAKFKILPGFVFRQSKPAVVGIEILAGTLHPGCRLMLSSGRVIGKIRTMQKEKEDIKSASKGEQVAVSIDDVVVGRHAAENDVLYTFLSIEDAQKLKFDELSEDEVSVLREIKEIKKKKAAEQQ